MIIESSFLGRLTSEGRLKYQWQQAMAELDAQMRLAKLRLIQEQLLANQTKFVHIWLPFLNDFLSSAHIYIVTEKDMQEVEEMGSILFHTSLENNHHIAEEIWRLAVHTYTLRGEEVQVCALLTRMFHSPSIKKEWRDWAAWQLAERDASDDNHLSIYMYYIQYSTVQTSPNPMLTILTRICCVNFDSDIAQLKRAKELSAYLVTSKIKIAEKWKASAFYALLVEHTPLEAIQLFMQAITEGNDDTDVVCGVLAASIQSGHFEHLTKITHIAKKLTSPIVTRLLTFADVLQWLDNQYESEYPSSTAQDIELLKNLKLHTYLDDVIDVVAGRLYLLEGKGYKASEILHAVIARHPEQSQWIYYASWADLLTNDHTKLASNFASSASWSGNWTIASLMLDADSTVAVRHLASSCLNKAINQKHIYACSIKARLALVHLYPLEGVEWIAHDGSLEEDMEALRITLGSAFYKRNNELLAKLIDFPLFHRLPMPDRLLWRGLHQLSLKNYVQGRKYLTEACDKFNYQRAALILTVHYLECNMLQEARLFMKKVRTGTNNSKIVLLCAYIEEQEGNGETVHLTYKKLLQRGETRAQYALGNYYLHKANYKDAVQAFRSVLNEKIYTHTDDLAVITLCTTFMVEPKHINLWNELEHSDASQKQMWLWWNAFLAQLWYNNTPDVIAIFDLLLPMLEHLGPKKDTVVLEIAKVLLSIW